MMQSKSLWVTVLMMFLILLNFLMWFGYPFESFDHINYIEFLNEPYPFFFEPLYTLVAFSLSNIVSYEYRFFAVFFLFVTGPSLLVMFLNVQHGRTSPQYIYFWILFKSSLIGFISQRFWFAELWMTYFILRYFDSCIRACVGFVFTSGIHFGIAGSLPLYYFLLNGTSRLFITCIAVLMVGVAYIVNVNYIFLGYDYSRYVGMPSERGFPYFSMLTMVLVCVLAILSLQKILYVRVIAASFLIFAFKVIFSDLDVYSRIFQVQVDVLIIFIALNGVGSRGALMLPIFSVIFVFGQALVAPTSEVVIFYINAAFTNAFENFKNIFY